jgi:formamidopyrimidine-DNA glycosylase
VTPQDLERFSVPELPEVETVVRDLRPLLVGCVLSDLRRSKQRLRTPWRSSWGSSLRGRTIVRIDRRGKWIVIILGDEARLLVHLGMTGQFCVMDASTPPADHTHLTFTLGSGEKELRFRDIRRFGTAVFLPGPDETDDFFRASGLGPEPFKLPADYWRERLADTNRCLKAVLLDQQVVAGVGNIYADESLFEARLPPWQIAATTSRNEADRLRRMVSKVLERAIESRGSSIRNYVGGSGLRGSYQQEFRVYGRTGDPCQRCETPIERIRLAGRSTHFCPRCQASKDGSNGASPSTSR